MPAWIWIVDVLALIGIAMACRTAARWDAEDRRDLELDQESIRRIQRCLRQISEINRGRRG